ncbi:EscU/YscU/HrcU family type III secretion system export apparatus switch protein [Microbacteriaceae bacterium K1510]|nr:EscU/YscU/HrcU family type III secretion system export apparatus switch protein [Microbacteriaceae bacterium K1510]
MTTRKLAVALEYERPNAPRVTAIGHDKLAEQIVELATEHGVPLHENPQLAAALSQVELEAEIPEKLYRAVAEVLGHVLRVSGKAKAERTGAVAAYLAAGKR